MSFPRFEHLNSEQYMNKAFDPEFHDQLEKSARIQRNLFLGLFATGCTGIVMAALTHQFSLSILAASLSVISLVVTTKYKTQLLFLRTINRQQPSATAR